MAPFRFWRSLWEKVFLLGWVLHNGTFQAFCCDVRLKYWFSACVSHLKGGSIDKSVQGITLQTGRLKPWRCTTPLSLTQNIHLSSSRLVVIKRLETLKRCKPATARLQRNYQRPLPTAVMHYWGVAQRSLQVSTWKADSLAQWDFWISCWSQKPGRPQRCAPCTDSTTQTRLSTMAELNVFTLWFRQLYHIWLTDISSLIHQPIVFLLRYCAVESPQRRWTPLQPLKPTFKC